MHAPSPRTISGAAYGQPSVCCAPRVVVVIVIVVVVVVFFVAKG